MKMFKLNKWLQVLAFLLPIITIGGLIIGYDAVDPYYNTDQSIMGRITNVNYAVGKTGGRVEIEVTAKDGRRLYFKKSSNKHPKIGGIVKLVILRRKYSGREKYILKL